MAEFFKKAITSFILGGVFIAGSIVFAAVSIPVACTTPGNCNELQTTLKSLVVKTALTLADADASNTVTLQAPTTVGTNVVLKLPANTGSVNQVLATDGAGNLSWVNKTDTKRIGEFVFKRDVYASDAAAIADGYLPVKPGTITNGALLYPLWAAKNPNFVSGNSIVFPSDVNGIFLRNLGGNASSVGVFQTDATAVNGLATSAAGDHNHSYVDYYFAENSGGNWGWYGSNSGYDTDNRGFSTNGTTANAGNHTHSLTGDAESRPDNRAYQLYTIIDTY